MAVLFAVDIVGTSVRACSPTRGATDSQHGENAGLAPHGFACRRPLGLVACRPAIVSWDLDDTPRKDMLEEAKAGGYLLNVATWISGKHEHSARD